jgi:hypothetical protein
MQQRFCAFALVAVAASMGGDAEATEKARATTVESRAPAREIPRVPGASRASTALR